MPTISPRIGNIAVIVILVACGAAGYCFVSRGGPSNGRTHTYPAPSRTNSSTAPHLIQVAKALDVKPSSQVDGAERPATPATPSLDGRTIVNCHYALRASQPIKRRCDKLKPGDTTGRRICQQLTVEDALFQQTMRGEAAACPSSLATASGYYEALRAAAQTGDVTAQECFIQGYFSTREDSDQISKQQYESYVRLTTEYIFSGLERGDWALVQWLARYSPNLQDYDLENAYPFGQPAPETLYKMNFLLTLGGATDNDVQRPQSIVRIYTTNGALTDQQIKDAKAWARDTYNNYFAATPYAAAPTSSFCRHGIQNQ